MQSLFDISMPAPFSYIIAVLVVLGLLAIFAIIVRRVAAHGPFPESGNRGRGPRLGLVDTFSLDRERQLVIIRRDNVEHLLMIGGSNDLVVETNIIRSVSAAGIREQVFPAATQTGNQDASQSFDLTEAAAPQPAPQMPAAAMPRLRPAQPSAAFTLPPQPARNVPPPEALPPITIAQPQFEQRETELPSAQPTYQPQPTYQAQPQIQSPVASAEAMIAEAAEQNRMTSHQNELIALAKRLESSLPTPAPRVEKPIVAAPTPSLSLRPAAPAPIAPPIPAPQMAPPVVTPPDIQAQLQVEPVMTPQPHMIPMPKPVQMPEPPAQSAPEPADPQTAALDENLRRLLGRKVEPRK